MNRVVVVGILLWAIALGTSGVAVAGTVAPDTVESTATDVTRTVEEGVVTIVGFGGDVRVRMSNESVSARARTGETTVGLEGIGTENASGSLSSPALGDSADPIRTGVCAAGLDGPDSPLGITVDEDAERASFEFRGYREPEPREVSAEEVVASCAG
ncbi:hypothetical protein ACFQE8_10285 [Salinirubellus sp. GCM10025818]|uniref:hypothetical protein n=1 Tax=Salinirubellus TaxID=2162630 RepID=UPI0030CFB60D